jgi:Tfp pilus assembly protein PilV
MKSQSNRKDHRNSRSGTTLVESMMAVLLLGGAIGGACHLAVSAKCVSDQSRAKYQAVNIARNQLERIRLVGYDQMGHWSESRAFSTHHVNHGDQPRADGGQGRCRCHEPSNTHF